ncbi:MAG: hypothetical protein ACJA0H_000308 [Francisellaceae bacterium]|jgi:hypothetical protein
MRSLKLSYLEYLRGDVESVKKRFENKVEHQTIEQEDNGIDEQTSWYKAIKDKNLNVPEELLTIHKLLNKTMDTVAHKKSYYPIITYTKMPSTIDHEHPIWKLKSKQTKSISAYLNSENQIIHTVNALYSAPILGWISGANKKQKLRWIAAAKSLIDELAEHYIETEKIHIELNMWLKPCCFVYWRV